MNQPTNDPLRGSAPFASTLFALTIILLLLLVACGTGDETEPGVPATQASRVQTTVTVVVPTAPAGDEAGAAGESAGTAPESTAPAIDSEAVPTSTPAPAGPAGGAEPPVQLPGMVYRTEDTLWQVGGGGESISLSTNSDLILSPAGDRGLYLADGDVWVVDLDGGAEQNVTAGSGRTHVTAQWWPARPDTLVLGSWGEGDQGPNSGRLTLVEVDGSNYRIVHPEGDSSYARPAPGPDGQTIAYDEAGSAWLYRLDSGAEPFPLATYLPRDVEVPRIASPAWSPSGDRLAWMMAVTGGDYGNEQGWDIALGIFDLANSSGSILHPYQTAGRGGWFPAPVWSPDGGWLVFSVEATGAEERGLWVTAADGSRETRLHPNANARAFWSPPGDRPWQNGAYLLLAEPGSNDPAAPAWLVAQGSWEETPVDRPAGAIFVEWRPLE